MELRKKSLIIYILLLTLTGVMMFILRGCDGKEIYPQQRIGDSGGDTIDVAIVYSPLNYYMYDDTLGGFNYDLLRLISREKGIVFRYWPIVGLDEAMSKLKNKTYDLLVSLPIDNELKKEFAYTSNIMLDRQVLVQKRSQDGSLTVTSSLDLAKDTLHIEKNSPVGFRINNLIREIGDTIYVVEHDNLSSEYLFFKVVNGEFDYVVVNEQIVKPLLEVYPEISIDTPISFTQFQAWLVNKEDTMLLNNLNKWIDELKTTEKYTDLKSKYAI